MISKGLQKLIESNVVAFATVNESGNPHCIAVACVKVVEGEKLVISNSHIRESVKNIGHNENVSLVVWNKEWEKACVGYEIKGKAKNYTSGEWLDFVRNLPDNEGYEIKSAIVVEVGSVKELES
jgi:predicted pyridoxine 5'-phosphate oxidase superfamily flavin-nucleotide-binding protein